MSQPSLVKYVGTIGDVLAINPKQVRIFKAVIAGRGVYYVWKSYDGSVYTEISLVVSATNNDVGSTVSDARLQVIQFGLCWCVI